MVVKYIHYYIIDFRDIMKPAIINKPFMVRSAAMDVVAKYFSGNDFKVLPGYRIIKKGMLKRLTVRGLLLYPEVKWELVPADVAAEGMVRTYNKWKRARIRRKLIHRLDKRVWVNRCIENNLDLFLKRYKETFNSDPKVFMNIRGAMTINNKLLVETRNGDWHARYPKMVYVVNILRTLVKYDYDNGPFRYPVVSLAIWREYQKEIINCLDVTRELGINL